MPTVHNNLVLLYQVCLFTIRHSRAQTLPFIFNLLPGVVCISGVCWDIAAPICTRERREAASKMDFIIHGRKCIQQSY